MSFNRRVTFYLIDYLELGIAPSSVGIPLCNYIFNGDVSTVPDVQLYYRSLAYILSRAYTPPVTFQEPNKEDNF